MRRSKSALYWILLLAGAGSFAISLLHVAIPLLGPWAYGYFGAAELMPLAQSGSLLPAAVTWTLAGVFAIFGSYAISVAGLIRKLPALSFGLAIPAVLYLARGLVFLPEAVQLLQGTLVPPRRALFSGASLLLGLLYAAALILFVVRGSRNGAPAA